MIDIFTVNLEYLIVVTENLCDSTHRFTETAGNRHNPILNALSVEQRHLYAIRSITDFCHIAKLMKISVFDRFSRF